MPPGLHVQSGLGTNRRTAPALGDGHTAGRSGCRREYIGIAGSNPARVRSAQPTDPGISRNTRRAALTEHTVRRMPTGLQVFILEVAGSSPARSASNARGGSSVVEHEMSRQSSSPDRELDGARPGRAPASGAGGRRFDSSRPDCNGPVAQLAEATVSETVRCRFESCRGHSKVRKRRMPEELHRFGCPQGRAGSKPVVRHKPDVAELADATEIDFSKVCRRFLLYVFVAP